MINLETLFIETSDLETYNSLTLSAALRILDGKLLIFIHAHDSR
jgi:hypothetical protein